MGIVMSQQGRVTFRCDGCGRAHKWSAAIAGRKVKCPCGRVFRVPDAEEPESAPDGLYDVAPSAVAPPPAPVQTARPAVQSIQYEDHLDPGESDGSDGASANSVRDKLVPGVLIGAAFLGVIVWVDFQTRSGFPGAILMAALLAAATFVKIIVVIGVAAGILPLFKLRFGNPLTAGLKLAALLLFIDVARLWVDVGVEGSGAFASPGRAVGRAFTIDFLATAAMIFIGVYCLFDLGGEDSKMVVWPTAALMIIMTVVLSIAVTAAIQAIRGSGIAPPAVTVTTSRRTVTFTVSPPPAAPAIPPTPADAAIRQRIQSEINPLIEGGEWIRSGGTSDSSRRRVVELIQAFHAAGATKVYVGQEILAASQRANRRGLFALQLYVELPAAAAKRTACEDVAAQYLAETNTPQAADAPKARQFLVIDVTPN
jgi:hypothetical protein